MRWIVIGALALEMAAMTWLVAKAQDRGLPDPALTPGVVVDVDKATLCQVGYAASVRHYDREIRNQVFASYGLTAVDRRDYELDHLVPLSLAGGDEPRNMWPQSRRSEPFNAEVKDTLEDVLHHEVCAGRMPLAEAQEAIRTDWIAAYAKYVGGAPRRFVARSAEER
ncbi:HNH endonuclease [Methylocella tundrae]|nr:HNH endonuclease [Methylocella tundrae]WPP02773.1 hypothetical protein SIN04_00250 [Methylocella tundrae]